MRHCTSFACLLIAGALSVSLAGCGAGSVSGSEPHAAPLPQQPVTRIVARAPAPDPLTAYYELPAGSVRVTGVVFSAGEDMLPLRPFQAGTVVALTRQRYDKFRLDARGPWKSALLEGRNFPLPGKLIAERGVHRSDLDAGGTYSLTIPPGDYMLCLGDLSAVDREETHGPDVWVDKVFEAEVTDEDLQTIIPVLNRSTGELTLHH